MKAYDESGVLEAVAESRQQETVPVHPIECERQAPDFKRIANVCRVVGGSKTLGLLHGEKERLLEAAELIEGMLRQANAAAAPKWLPIETAPKDGTWILVCGGQILDDGEDREYAVVQWTTYLNGSQTEGHWQFSWYDGGYLGGYSNPTHWMPLPAAPVADANMAQKEKTNG